jgi:hypothetical protein
MLPRDVPGSDGSAALVKPLAQRSMPCQAVPVADRVRFFRFITESVPYRYLTEKLTPGGPLFPDCGPR